jgi:hypothetical protein
MMTADGSGWRAAWVRTARRKTSCIRCQTPMSRHRRTVA